MPAAEATGEGASRFPAHREAARPAPLRETPRTPALAARVRTWRAAAFGRAAALARALSGPEVVAAVAAVLLYLPAAGFGFVFDDLGLIAPDGSPARVGAVLPYRPVRYASYLVDAALGGSPAVYHAHNLLLHALAAALLVRLARRAGAGAVAAAAGGLLLALHPLAVEAAAYVSGRRDLLAVVLGLGAMLAMDAGRSAVAAAMLLVAAGAKESGLVFAAPLAVQAATSLPRALRRKALAGLLAAVAAALAVALAGGAVGPWLPPMSWAAASFPGHVAAHYVRGLLGLRALAPDYPLLMDVASRLRGGDAALLLAGAAGTGLLLAVAVLAVRRVRAAANGDAANPHALALAWVAAAALALATAGGLHEPGVDRHAYLLLPAAGFALALLLERVRRHGAATSRFAFAVAAIALAVAATASRAQMKVWAGEEALWTHAAAQPVVSTRTRANLARVLAAAGRPREARAHLDAALAVEPGDPSLLLSRAAVRCAAGQRAKARADLDLARSRGASDESVAALAADCPLPRLAEVLRGAPLRPASPASARKPPEIPS